MSNSWGSFSGSVVARWWNYPNHRNMTVVREIYYTDPRGSIWAIPEEAIINGASAGWFLRRLFPAYVGPYRRASAFHDYECTAKNHPSREVHRMFYEAMRCDGVGPIKAWLMWAVVRQLGPRF